MTPLETTIKFKKEIIKELDKCIMPEEIADVGIDILNTFIRHYKQKMRKAKEADK